jgi:butyrate kinase
MIDGNDVVGGDGPMTPTRCGSMPVAGIMVLLEKGGDSKLLKELCQKTGGMVSHFDTSDARELTGMAASGNKAAARLWHAMIYQIIKYIGSMATVLKGDIDGILLGGGLVNDKGLVAQITEACSWIAPVSSYPGEFEMEALAAGAIRVLRGDEKARDYSGVPVWSGFDE